MNDLKFDIKENMIGYITKLEEKININKHKSFYKETKKVQWLRFILSTKIQK